MRHCIVAPCALLSLLALPARATEVGTSRVFGIGLQVGDVGLGARAYF